MTEKQWQELCDVVNGNGVTPLPVGFIIDSPWLPGWANVPIIDYFAGEQVWLEANLKALTTFPDVIFLPGFWAEFGMCTEPSAFGCKCVWPQNNLPFAEKIITDITEIDRLRRPAAAKDGLLPFVLNRLQRCRSQIEKAGHSIKFAVSRGPLNICSFLMGTTEFLLAIRNDRERMQKLLEMVTDFIIDWVCLQKASFDSIDGVFILDDIVGFLGPDDFRRFAYPFLKRIFGCLDVSIKFFHNDADGRVCAPHLAEIGVNLFNFSSNHTPGEMKEWTGGKVALLGGIPPRDVLAAGSPKEVAMAVKAAIESFGDNRRIILSCGGGMPPGVTTENIQAFIDATRETGT